MAFQPEEVSSIIQAQLEKHDVSLEMESVGSILQIGDGIVRIWGLEDAMAGELLEFPGGIYGMILNLEEDNVGAVLFGPDVGIKEGDAVKRTGKVTQVPVGEALLGRVVDSLGQPIDGRNDGRGVVRRLAVGGEDLTRFDSNQPRRKHEACTHRVDLSSNDRLEPFADGDLSGHVEIDPGPSLSLHPVQDSPHVFPLRQSHHRGLGEVGAKRLSHR